MPDMHRRHRLGVSPVTVAIIGIVTLVGAILLGVSGYRVKPASGTGQAMALATEGSPSAQERRRIGNTQ